MTARDGATAVHRCAEAIARSITRPWTLMEVCGGQTHAILQHGLDQLLPPGLELVHGPGCPVCVTPAGLIDQAIALARRPGVTVCSFGDMLRVPGAAGDTLLAARARGGDVRMVYSPLDALALARAEPARDVVFFAVGFETTAPANAVAVARAAREGLGNFSLLCAQVRVPPAMQAILEAPDNRVQGFIAAGHVCTVMGLAEYWPLAARHRVPVVVTGFSPQDILEGVLLCVLQLERGQARVENPYARAVRHEGNRAAQTLMDEVFAVVPREWRGMGTLAASGLALAPRYAAHDAVHRFGLAPEASPEPPGRTARETCRAGEVLQGRLRPDACPAFGRGCTPESPLGAPMVSSEGACAAYFRYRGRRHA
jgi:hydrogenase expression/formation protein HypD